jgi:hypothetical protein
LPGAYKLLWDYLYHAGDHAGVWIVDFEITQIYLGQDMPVNKEDALKYFNQDEERIIELNHGSKWFIPSFIEFQYGILNENNKVHHSILQIFKKHNIDFKGLGRGLHSPKDKDKEMDKDKDKEIDLIYKILMKEIIDKYKLLTKKDIKFKKQDYIMMHDIINTFKPTEEEIKEKIQCLFNKAKADKKGFWTITPNKVKFGWNELYDNKPEYTNPEGIEREF